MYNFQNDLQFIADFPGCELGEGFGKLYTRDELQEGADNIRAFPPTNPVRRLSLQTPGCGLTAGGRLSLPSGFDLPVAAHYANGLLSRRTGRSRGGEVWQVPKQVQSLFEEKGLTLDWHGRPCHPLFPQLLGPAGPGLSTGIGKSHLMGEAITMSVAIVVQGRLFMKGSEGLFSLPRVDLDRGRMEQTIGRQRKSIERQTAAHVLERAMTFARKAAGDYWPDEAKPRIARASRPIELGTLLNRWSLRFLVVLPELDRLPLQLKGTGVLVEPSNLSTYLRTAPGFLRRDANAVFGA